jgi:hypothetical protein
MRTLLCGALLLAGCYDWDSLSYRFGSERDLQQLPTEQDLASGGAADLAAPQDMATPPTLTWTKEPTGLANPAALSSIFGAGSAAIWAVGDRGQVVRYNAAGKSWSPVTVGSTMEDYQDVWLMPDNTSGWIVGNNGTAPVAYRWNSTNGMWTSDSSMLGGQQRAVWGNAASSVLSASSVTRNVYQYTSAWVQRGHGVNETFAGIWGTGSRFWLVGGGNSWLIFDGASFTSGSLSGVGSTAFTSVWGFAADNVWAVGASGYTAQYRGTAWADGGRIPMTPNMRGVWGAAPNDLWAVGDGGVVAHYDGTAWTRMAPTQLGGRLNAIWGYDAMNFWVVNDRGEIYRAY